MMVGRVMRRLQRLAGHWGGLGQVAGRRLLYEPGLTLALLSGWVAAVALFAAIPMYSDAINQALLRKELKSATGSHRPVFGFLFHYTKDAREAPWSHYLALRHYVETTLDQALALPRQTMMHYVKSDLFQFFPVLAGTYRQANDPLSRVYVGFVSGLDQHSLLNEGNMPSASWTPGEPLEVLVSAAFAEKLGLQVGELFVLFNVAGVEGATESFAAPVRISGVWQPAQPNDPFWYIPSSAFDETLLVSPELYVQLQSDQLPSPLYEVGWYMAYDGGSVRAAEVDRFLDRVASVQSRVGALMPGARLALSPVAALQRYRLTVAAQSLLILVLGLPVLGLVLLFIASVAANLVERQRLEIAILKSRGSSSGQIASLFLLQGLALSVLALGLGLPAGWLAAQAMGSTRQFLVFERVTPLTVAITGPSVRFALGAVVLALVVTVAPAVQAARLTVVAAKQRIGRPRLGSLLLRLGGDLLLLLCAGYAYYLLAGQGGFARLAPGERVDPWQNPLLFVAPALFLLAGAQLYRHLLPVGLRLGEWLAGWLPGVAILLSLRNLARNGQQYGLLLTLLLLTTGLGAYVTSFARTADENLVARTYYRIGANLVVTEGAGLINRAGVSVAQPGAGNATAQPASAGGLPGWALLPVTEHLRVAGVRAAARVGRFPAQARTSNAVIAGELYGIDREDFPKAAYFRRDFASLSLGALMNELALEPSGILVTRQFVEQTTLQVGDTIQLTGLIAGTSQPLQFKIVGIVDLFPTAYPDENPFFVANLEYIFTELGGPLPYFVWLEVEEGLSTSVLATELEELGFQILDLDDVRAEIAAEQTRPERIGLFGFFSLGFVVTTLLSILAVITHAALMYQRHYIQIGIMRAIGLSSHQVAAAQASEHLLIIALGVVGGAGLGLVCSELFIPFMQIGYRAVDRVPPFVVVIAWPEVLFSVLVIVGVSLLVVIGMAWLLARLPMFNAIKLGEAMN